MIASTLQKARYEYSPKTPKVLNEKISDICAELGEATQAVADHEDVKSLFPNTYGKPLVVFKKGKNTMENKPLRVGVILSGGQAPGGHNVICGLFDGLKNACKDSVLFGFLGGPSGLIDGKYVELIETLMNKPIEELKELYNNREIEK